MVCELDHSGSQTFICEDVMVGRLGTEKDLGGEGGEIGEGVDEG